MLSDGMSLVQYRNSLTVTIEPNMYENNEFLWEFNKMSDFDLKKAQTLSHIAKENHVL